MTIQRGDIRWFRASSPDKRRPVIVLGEATAIASLSEIPVVPLSTKARDLPWEVKLTQAEGLPSPCVAKPEWIRAVNRMLLGARICGFPDGRWDELKDAVLRALGFPLSASR